MKALKVIIVIILSVGLVVGLQKYFGKSAPSSQRRRGGASPVVVKNVTQRRFASRIEAIGTARANESITVTSTVAERIEKIVVKDGAQVKKGELLVELQHAQETALMEEARINLAEQKRELDRIKSLRKQNVLSQQKLDSQVSAYDAAKSQLAAANAVLRDRMIIAPFSGVLGIRQVSPGAFVSPGEVITTLDDISVIKLDFTVPETYLAELKNGQIVNASSVAWPGREFTGKVTGIDSRVDPVTRAVAVQAVIENKDLKLRAGMLLAVELISRPRDAVNVPEKALISYEEKQFVYVLKGQDTVEKRQVALGQREAGYVEITDGLSEGEVVVIEGIINLVDGAKVVVAKPKNAESDASDKK